jgi:hypothetical protein
VKKLVHLFLPILFACGSKPGPVVVPAVFHWGNSSQLERSEREALQQHDVQRVYIKVLELAWHPSYGPYPVAQVHIPRIWQDTSASASAPELVPCITIQNTLLAELDEAGTTRLASSLLRKVKKDLPAHIHGIMLDCDWTTSTRDRFFQLARIVRDSLSIPVSAAIRLDQFADAKGLGVPPVDRCMLIPYTEGRSLDGHAARSPFNEPSAKAYFQKAGKYPLPLDLALPAFSWGVHYRGEEALGILDEAKLDEALMLGLLSGERDGMMNVTREHDQHLHDLRLGDVVHVERTTPEMLTRIVELARTAMNTDTIAVAFFESGSPGFQRLDTTSVRSMWNTFGMVRTRAGGTR